MSAHALFSSRRTCQFQIKSTARSTRIRTASFSCRSHMLPFIAVNKIRQRFQCDPGTVDVLSTRYVETSPALAARVTASMTGGIPFLEHALQLPLDCAAHAFAIAKLRPEHNLAKLVWTVITRTTYAAMRSRKVLRMPLSASLSLANVQAIDLKSSIICEDGEVNSLTYMYCS